MEIVDVLNDDAFSMASMSEAINEAESPPDHLESMGIFRPEPIRTETVMIEKQSEKLSLVQTSERGMPVEQRAKGSRDIRHLSTTRIAKGDTIRASELAFVRGLGETDAIQAVQEEFARRMGLVRDDMRLTKENMRLGAMQGLLTDADGTVIYDYASEFGIAKNAETTFALGTLSDGALREKIANTVIRPMRKAAKGARYTQVHAKCGDEFWDNLIKNPEVRETYKIQNDGAELRNSGLDFVLNFGGVLWENYQGDDESKVAIPATKVKFFPGGQGSDVFKEALAPGESFADIGQLGQEWYAMQLMDEKRNQFVELEVYSYPLFYCRRPKMLFSGKL